MSKVSHPSLLKVGDSHKLVYFLSLFLSIFNRCYTEALGLCMYDPASTMPIDALAAMRNCSPIQHASNVKAPTCLMLGKKDLRVPYSQGLMYYHTLHANGIATKYVSINKLPFSKLSSKIIFNHFFFTECMCMKMFMVLVLCQLKWTASLTPSFGLENIWAESSLQSSRHEVQVPVYTFVVLKADSVASISYTLSCWPVLLACSLFM